MKRRLGLVWLVLLLGGAASARAQSSFFYILPDSISFGTVTVGQSITRSVSTYRSADDGTVVTATSNHPAFTVSPSSQVVGTDGASFTVRFQPTLSGTQLGIITFSVTSQGQTRVLGELPVDGTGYAPFTVNPTTLTFDPLLAGDSSTQTFRILVNPQAGALDLTLQSSNPAFSVSPASFSGLQSGQAGVATVTFAPSTAGSPRGAISVVGGGATVLVVVEGDGAAFVVSPTQLNFGGTLVGCAVSLDFNVMTGGQFDFSVVPTAPGLPFTAEPAAFSADEPIAVTARFTPTSPGPVQGAFRIFARSSGRIVQQQDLLLSGSGVEAFPQPAFIDFGAVPAGTTSAPRSTIVMTNPSGSFQGAYSATSDNPAFRVVGTNTSGRVEVVFSPSAEGPANGITTVQVSSQSDRTCSMAIEVPVQGVATPAPLTLSPTSLDFGMVPVGQSSTAREILVSNQSAASFTGTVSSNNAAFDFNPATSAVAQTTLTVPAGGSARLPVVFQPTSLGEATGTITFTFRTTPAGGGEALSLTRTVAARGEGVPANLSYVVTQAGGPVGVSPGGTVNFGPTGVGTTNSVSFEIRNEGSLPVPIDAVTISDAPVFTAGLPALPTSIAPGGALTLTLNFQPAALAAFNGTLEVGFAAFTLEGNGVLSQAQITGLTDTIPANSQPEVGVTLSEPAPQNLNGTLNMLYTPAGSLRPDPSAQFESGGTAVSFSVPQGATAAVFPGGATMIGFQSGTVAASFVFSAWLAAADTDVTPFPEPTRTASVAGGAPAITRITVESVTATGFTVVVEGFSPTREITQATFNFAGRSGIQVQPASVTPAGIGDAFRNWYQSEASAAYGSMFTLTVPFTISGETNAIASVSATVSNAQGASPPASANLP